MKIDPVRLLRVAVSSLPVWFAILVMPRMLQTHPGESLADAQRHTLFAWGTMLLVVISMGIVMLLITSRTGRESSDAGRIFPKR